MAESSEPESVSDAGQTFDSAAVGIASGLDLTASERTELAAQKV
jgi:hypothetical protein